MVVRIGVTVIWVRCVWSRPIGMGVADQTRPSPTRVSGTSIDAEFFRIKLGPSCPPPDSYSRYQISKSTRTLVIYSSRGPIRTVSEINGGTGRTAQVLTNIFTRYSLCRYCTRSWRPVGNEMSMQRHIGKVSSVCFYHLRRLRQIQFSWRRSIVVRTLVSAGELSLSCAPDC